VAAGTPALLAVAGDHVAEPAGDLVTDAAAIAAAGDGPAHGFSAAANALI
jgi:hypothetical protein